MMSHERSHVYFPSLSPRFGDSLRLSRWARARHMAPGFWRRTPPSGRSCCSPARRRWLCRGSRRARTGSLPPAPPAPRTAPAHLSKKNKTKKTSAGMRSSCSSPRITWNCAWSAKKNGSKLRLGFGNKLRIRMNASRMLQHQGNNSQSLNAWQHRRKWQTAVLIELFQPFSWGGGGRPEKHAQEGWRRAVGTWM